jgi:hypothetical protein
MGTPVGTARAITHPSAVAIARRPRRIAAAVLALIVAATAIAVAASGGSSSQGPWQQTFDATNGPHVVVAGLPGADLTPLRELPGLAAASGPFPGVDTSLRYHGKEIGVRLEGRPAAATAVDRPRLVSGDWVRSSKVVLERSTARALGVPLGGRLIVAAARGRVRLTVAGVAETAALSRSPAVGRGLGYVVPATLTGVAPKETFGSTMLLRLADPDRAGRYVDWIKQHYPGGQVTVEEPSRSR